MFLLKMDINNKLNEIDIKNPTCYYFDYIININDIDLDNIFLNKNSYEIFLIYAVPYKTPYGSKHLHITFEK